MPSVASFDRFPALSEVRKRLGEDEYPESAGPGLWSVGGGNWKCYVVMFIPDIPRCSLFPGFSGESDLFRGTPCYERVGFL